MIRSPSHGGNHMLNTKSYELWHLAAARVHEFSTISEDLKTCVIELGKVKIDFDAVGPCCFGSKSTPPTNPNVHHIRFSFCTFISCI